MNFRLVWMGPEEDDPQQAPAALGAAIFRKPPNSLFPYALRRGQMIRQQKLDNGRIKITPIANFQARIVRDVRIDDGAGQRREFGIEAVMRGQTICFSVPASAFHRMSWVPERLGPQAIVFPGQTQHVRAAIQWLSGAIRTGRIYTHLGWTKHAGEWIYLHAAGAQGAKGPASGVRVELPGPLQSFRFESGEACVNDIRMSLDLLRIAPDRISFPLLAAAYSAALGSTGFSLFLAGGSGVFKTALAAVVQQHFGAAIDASSLPANFASTANALESLAYYAKNALLVVDDFAPTGTAADAALRHVAERLFRAAGNQQGRSRLGGPQSLAAAFTPRCLLLATGEDVPQGHSIRARLLIIDVSPGDVDRNVLTGSQRAARQGSLAAAMAGFLAWAAGKYDSLLERRRERVEELRDQGMGREIHARLSSAAAELQIGFEMFLEFAIEAGAVTEAEAGHLRERCKLALHELLEEQAKHHQSTDPATRFISLLRAGLAAAKCHVAGREGGVPEHPAAYGWQKSRGWVRRGPRIGWLVGPNLYIDSTAGYEAAQHMAGNQRLTISEQTLRHRLRERGLLASVDTGRQMLLVRRTLEGCSRQVLHLRASDLLN